MTISQEYQCAIWPETHATERQSDLTQGIAWYVSVRAGGEYSTTRQAEHRLRYLGDSHEAQRVRARLTTWLVEMRQQGEEWPLVTGDVIEEVRLRRDLPPHERADRLLQYFADIPRGIGTQSVLDETGLFGAMAQCECVDQREVHYLIEFLVSRGWFNSARLMNHVGGTVTVQGHARVADVMQVVDPARCFVAMWFGAGMDQVYKRGIAPAICGAGYKPHAINRDPEVDKVDDAIIAAIRRAKFVVADCTHGDDGVRGSVYYEIGFAHGLGKEVVFTCRNDLIDGIHFDIRQHFQIGWTEPEELIRPLRDRIIARVGTGPHYVDTGE